MKEESVYPMLVVGDTLAIVLEQVERLPVERVALREAVGRILAEDVYATEPQPPFAASVKDGYAVIAADGPGDYPLIGEVTAGRPAHFTVQRGSVAYITTGAPIPPGADAVVMVEETERFPAANSGAATVRIRKGARAGDDVRAVGVDVAAGQQMLAAGERLGPSEIGLLATVGISAAPVHGQPVVAVLSTGDEVVDPADSPGPGQIRDSNRAALAAAVATLGARVLDLGIARDERSELEAKIRRGLAEADVLLTSGGVSMGELDLIQPILEQVGTVHFGRLRMKPGKPLTFATVQVAGRRKLVFGLPGNPVSSMVTFFLMAAPAIRKLAGEREPQLPRVQAVLAQPLALDSYRPEFHRATLRWDMTLNDGRGGYLAVSTGSQASSRLLSLRSANALLELPQAEGRLEAGAVVTALLLP